MKSVLPKILQRLISNQKQTLFSAGFTLVEVLAATIMSGIVISSLLLLMLDVMRSSAAETARKDTLQDMRRALEFMTDDLKEAVYVYTGEQLEDRDVLAGSNDGIEDILNLRNLEPILVFWKLEDVPYTDGDRLPNEAECDSLSGDQQQECEELRIAQRTYTLVAYVQDNDPTNTWQGESVIYRYQLRKYEDVSTLTQETSYEDADPVKNSSFANWPYDRDGNLPPGYSTPPTDDSDNPEIDRRASNALVDFVDVPNNDDFSDEEMGCLDGYARTPSEPSTANSFYACVEENADADGGTATPANKATVIVHLRGNPNGRVSFNLGDSTSLPTLNSSVVLRGSSSN